MAVDMIDLVWLSRALVVGAAFFVACGGPTPAPAPEAEPEQTPDGVDTDAEAAAGTPKIAAAEPVHEFGGIKASDTIEHTFTIKNEGDAELKIDHVQRT